MAALEVMPVKQVETKASPRAARPRYKHTKLGWIPEERKVPPGRTFAVVKGSTPRWQGFRYHADAVSFGTRENFPALGEYLHRKYTNLTAMRGNGL